MFISSLSSIVVSEHIKLVQSLTERKRHPPPSVVSIFARAAVWPGARIPYPPPSILSKLWQTLLGLTSERMRPQNISPGKRGASVTQILPSAHGNQQNASLVSGPTPVSFHEEQKWFESIFKWFYCLVTTIHHSFGKSAVCKGRCGSYVHVCVLLSWKAKEKNKQAKGQVGVSPLSEFWLKMLCSLCRLWHICCCFLLTLRDLWHWNSSSTALCRLILLVEPVRLLQEQVHCQAVAVRRRERLWGRPGWERADLWLVPFQLSCKVWCCYKRSHSPDRITAPWLHVVL